MKRTIRPIIISGNTAFITLTKGYIATIDAADVALVEGVNWCATTDPHNRTVYALRGALIDGRWTTIKLHRQIMDPPHGLQVDHISGDGLDCRRDNMRLATRAQNVHNSRRSRANTSGFKGVSWHVGGQKWQAMIWGRGKNKHLGHFTTPEEAHQAYVEAAERLWGDFARAG